MSALHLAILSRPANFHAEKWAQALARAGARVTLFTLDAPTPVPGCEVVQIAPALTWGGRYRYPSYWLSAPELRHQFARHGIHVVHPLHLTPFGSWGLWAGHRPLIAAAMGADVFEYPPAKARAAHARTWREAELQTGPLDRLKAAALNRFFRRRVADVIAGADLLTGDNQPLVDAMREWFGAPPAKLRLLRWGLEPERFAFDEATQHAVRAQFGIAPHRRLLLSPRGANAIYQADVILAAFERLFAQQPQLLERHHVLMLGAGYDPSGPVAARAQALAQRVPNFTFVPQQLPRAEVYRLWALTDLFISAPVYDGYSAAVAEGRYAGAVPVVNAIPGNLEIIRHEENGLVVEPFTADALGATLRYALPHVDALKQRFAPRNRAWIERHSLLHRNAATLLTWADALRRGVAVPRSEPVS